MMPGVRTGEEAAELPEGAVRNSCSPPSKSYGMPTPQNVLPVDWAEIAARCRLWAREMSDPARAIERATDFRLFDATMKSWQEHKPPLGPRDIAGGRRGSSRQAVFGADWEQNPFSETLKESYLLASEYLLDEAEKTDGRKLPSSGVSSSISSSS